MTFDGFKIDLNSRSAVGVCLTDDKLSEMTSENVTTEDKITELFDALRGPILSYLIAVFGRSTTAEAEDILQEAFLQLHRSLQKGAQIENARAWLFRAAHNLAINRLKSRQFIAALEDLQWEEICRKLPDPGISPEQRAQRLEDFALVHQAMTRLTLPERQCLHLRAEGLRYKEIADILNISVPSVGQALRRAIKKVMLENIEADASM